MSEETVLSFVALPDGSRVAVRHRRPDVSEEGLRRFVGRYFCVERSLWDRAESPVSDEGES